MSQSNITNELLNLSALTRAQTQLVEKEANKQKLKASDYLEMLSKDLSEQGVSKQDIEKFVNDADVQKAVAEYAKNHEVAGQAQGKMGAQAAGAVGFYETLMLVFANRQSQLNDQVAFWDKKQAAINKILAEITNIINDINSQLNNQGYGGKNYPIPKKLLEYIKEYGPSSIVNSDGKTVNESLYKYIMSNKGSLPVSFENAQSMAKVFAGFQTNLTSNSTVKTSLQRATQTNLNFTKLMGQLITTIFGMLKANAAKL